MNRWVIFLVAIWVGVGTSAAPVGGAHAMILLPAGGTRVEIAWGMSGPAVEWSRIVSPRMEVIASSSPADLFSIRAKVLLVGELVPLFVAALVGTDGHGVVGTLFLGPVEVSAGRRLGKSACRWAHVQLAAEPGVSLVLGGEAFGEGWQPFAAVRIFPQRDAVWEIGLSIRGDGIRLSLGGWL